MCSRISLSSLNLPFLSRRRPYPHCFLLCITSRKPPAPRRPKSVSQTFKTFHTNAEKSNRPHRSLRNRRILCRHDNQWWLGFLEWYVSYKDFCRGTIEKSEKETRDSGYGVSFVFRDIVYTHIAWTGTGWGALNLVRKLHCDKYDVTIVSPRNYFLFTPLLAGSTVGT